MVVQASGDGVESPLDCIITCGDDSSGSKYLTITDTFSIKSLLAFRNLIDEIIG